jgi:hypothetical protein
VTGAGTGIVYFALIKDLERMRPMRAQKRAIPVPIEMYHGQAGSQA